MPLSYDELNREYRAALRREVQLRARVQDMENVLVRFKGKLLGDVQAIDYELERIAREDARHAIGHEISRLDGTK